MIIKLEYFKTECESKTRITWKNKKVIDVLNAQREGKASFHEWSCCRKWKVEVKKFKEEGSCYVWLYWIRDKNEGGKGKLHENVEHLKLLDKCWSKLNRKCSALM